VLKLVGWVFLGIAAVAGALHRRTSLQLRFDSEFRSRSKTRLDTLLFPTDESTYNAKGGRLLDQSRTLLIVAFVSFLIGLILVLSDVIHVVW
jgi:hypothetical protein